MSYHVGDIVTFNKSFRWGENEPVFNCELLQRRLQSDPNVWLLRPIDPLPRPINQIVSTRNDDGTFWCHINFFRPSEIKPIAVDTADLL